MELFKSEPILDRNGLFVYPPNHERENVSFSYNGVALPPLPKV